MKRVLLILLLLLFAVSSRADTGLNWWQAFGVSGSSSGPSGCGSTESCLLITSGSYLLIDGSGDRLKIQ